MNVKETRRQNLARLLHGYESDKVFADRTGLSAAYISQMKSGTRKMGDQAARRIENSLGLRNGWIDYPHTSTNDPGAEYAIDLLPTEWAVESQIPEDEFLWVARFNVEAAAGEGRVNGIERQKQPLPFRRDWIEKNGLAIQNLVLIYAHGDSMSTTIEHGDALLVDTSDADIKDGAIYAFVVDSQLRVKRLFARLSGRIMLRSDNYYPDEEIDAEHIRIIGRVVWRAGTV